MKFRAKMSEISSIHQFTNIIAVISKLCKSCTLRISSDKMYFVVVDRSKDGSCLWCEIDQTHFFEEYLLEGLCPEHNEIYLEVQPENITKILKSCQNAKWMKIKITKKHNPCLTFEVELPSSSMTARRVIHDTQVNVIPLRLWSDYKEPEMRSFDVSFTMPPLKSLKNIVSRMKSLSGCVIVAANKEGDMNLKVENEMVTVTTHFHDLDVHTWNDDDDVDSPHLRNIHQFPEVKVDIRCFAQILNSYHVNPSKIMCNIIHGRMLQLFLFHDDVSLQYFIPAVND